MSHRRYQPVNLVNLDLHCKNGIVGFLQLGRCYSYLGCKYLYSLYVEFRSYLAVRTCHVDPGQTGNTRDGHPPFRHHFQDNL